jgi:ABC-type dipeptide/oligopeptide/nickel transport system ATPase component
LTFSGGCERFGKPDGRDLPGADDSLNPVLTVGLQITEALLYHKGIPKREAQEKALEIMRQVKIPSAESRFSDYPHQFSGGMRQRVMIAMALACQPDIILADEPTTALDVTIRLRFSLWRGSKTENGRCR